MAQIKQAAEDSLKPKAVSEDQAIAVYIDELVKTDGTESKEEKPELEAQVQVPTETAPE